MNSRLTYLNSTESYCNCYKRYNFNDLSWIQYITDIISNQNNAFFHQLSHQSISEIKERMSIAPSVVIFCINWMMKKHIPLIRNSCQFQYNLQHKVKYYVKSNRTLKSTFSNPNFGAICCSLILNWLELFCHSWVKIVFVPYIIRRPALQNRKMLHPAVLDNTMKPNIFWKCLKMSKPLHFNEYFLNYYFSGN